MLSLGLSRRLKIGVLVHELSRLRRKAIDQLLQPLGITGSQWWVLTYISLRPGLSQARLADELNLGKVALGGLIERLMKLDLVDRRTDSHDKRVKLIYLSQTGMALAKEIRHISSGVQDSALEGISQEELDLSISVLMRMKDNLEKTLGVVQSDRVGALV
ncbi:MAG: MarR family winged helix-turn-helix transcriptional regulator [Burkholderiaceae bacterium]|nr:MarR family winged helix-turn-helix transcriptional regulator [Burkholderiaceae bacterium]